MGVPGKKLIVCVFTLLACLFSFSPRIHAQVAGATLSGTVTDQSGSAVSGAQVAIRNSKTGITTTVDANSDGFFSAPNLQPGTYEVTTTATGFATTMRSGVVLTVGAQQVLNIALQVGQISQKLEVTREAPAIDLTSSAISGVVNSTTAVELPLNGRDWALLATLEPYQDCRWYKSKVARRCHPRRKNFL